MFKPGKAFHPSNGTGSAPDAAATPGGVQVSFDQSANRNRQATITVIVSNLEAVAGNNLEVSFNNGRSFFVIPPAQTISFPVIVQNMRVRGAASATTDYSIVGIVG